MKINDSHQSFKSDCAVSSVVEHFLDTEENTSRSAPEIDAISRVFANSSNVSPNKVPNGGRFVRVDRCLHRQLRTGELWFVGRHLGKVLWKRLRTPDLRLGRLAAAMIGSNLTGVNGNTAVYL